MSRVLEEPVGIGYPVNFTSGGDTTRDAFGKHIDEIKRIYGFLRALDIGKVSADEVSSSLGNINTSLSNHISSTNPHPNWRPNLSELNGTLDASKVVGKLTNATIDASRVNGLTALIHESSGDGIMDSDMDDNGYVKFKNGLIIQWGREVVDGSNFVANWENPYAVTFPISFSNRCFIVAAGTEADIDDSKSGRVDLMIQTKDIGKTGFKFMTQVFYKDDYNGWDHLYCNYIAIGK